MAVFIFLKSTQAKKKNKFECCIHLYSTPAEKYDTFFWVKKRVWVRHYSSNVQNFRDILCAANEKLMSNQMPFGWAEQR
jgi:hypothetical protein